MIDWFCTVYTDFFEATYLAYLIRAAWIYIFRDCIAGGPTC